MNKQDTLNYYSNFDADAFTNKPREFNKLIDDTCDIKQRNFSNEKTLKFTTTTYRDLFDAEKNGNYFSIGVNDQLFVPSKYIDTYSELLNGDTGNTLTNCNVRHDMGELPLPTMPSRYQGYHGDIQTEDNMRNLLETNKKSCNPRDQTFYIRSFYVFEQVDVPNPLDSIESMIRCGTSSRYPAGIKKGKNFKTNIDISKVEPSIFQCNTTDQTCRLKMKN